MHFARVSYGVRRAMAIEALRISAGFAFGMGFDRGTEDT